MNHKPIILDGKRIRDERRNELSGRVNKLGFSPQLAIFQVGNSRASDTYIRQKEIFGAFIGVIVNREICPDNISTEDLLEKIKIQNEDDKVNGIIIQLGLPPQIDTFKISQSVDPKKDVDGFSGANLKALLANRKGFVPATTRGIIELLDFYSIPIAGKNVCIIGRSELVGKPTALAFLNRNATVEICHSKTLNLKDKTKRADILISAIGKPRIITSDFVSPGQVVIDVGINRGEDGKLLGDVLYEEVVNQVGAITPVPGGVGPMTVLSLFENLLDACETDAL